MGENVCWKWVATLKVENIYQNKVCMQGHYVWRMFWVQKKLSFYVYDKQNNDIATKVPKPKVRLLYNNYFLLELCDEYMCDELIKKALDLIKCLDYYW
jgi:hypothetical protein